jgi:lysozyme family protein
MKTPEFVIDLISKTIVAEGGDKFTNDPLDKGGATKYGITQFAYNAFGFSGSVEFATREQAEKIYLERYWLAPNFEAVHSAGFEKLSEVLFDWGVTSGPSVPTKALQRALNALNEKGEDWPDINLDGRIGRMTVAALVAFGHRRTIEGKRYLLEMVQAQRRVFYMEISERDKTQERFQNGWQSRIK